MTRTSSHTLAARYAQGVKLRRKIVRQNHADLLGRADRDPVAILAAGDRTRLPNLIPVRYQRMLPSPFAFLRGAAAVMAQDLSEPTRLHDAGNASCIVAVTLINLHLQYRLSMARINADHG